ncbi:MAG TPA: hypothetical protein VF638_02305 [Sphingomonas sp.]|jgi:hypothetical protein
MANGALKEVFAIRDQGDLRVLPRTPKFFERDGKNVPFIDQYFSFHIGDDEATYSIKRTVQLEAQSRVENMQTVPRVNGRFCAVAFVKVCIDPSSSTFDCEAGLKDRIVELTPFSSKSATLLVGVVAVDSEWETKGLLSSKYNTNVIAFKKQTLVIYHAFQNIGSTDLGWYKLAATSSQRWDHGDYTKYQGFDYLDSNDAILSSIDYLFNMAAFQNIHRVENKYLVGSSSEEIFWFRNMASFLTRSPLKYSP